MSKARALIVDDERDIIDLLRISLSRLEVDCQAALGLGVARRLLATEAFDLCLTDMRLPDGDGIDLVREIASHYPQLPVAMITAHGSIDSAVAAMKAGAFDFVAKPLDLQVLHRLVEAALRLRPPDPAMADGRGVREAGDKGPALLGDSPAMIELRRLIAKLARNQAPVYISGESGTGKELAARLIHLQGPRATAPFVPVNCGAIPPDLVESELFGHKKGAFTGAISDNAGLFQAAHGGTLFLDEIAELPLPAQVKLLRVLQEKRARPVGSQREVAVDVRLMSSTHRDLAAEVAAGHFRQDLFYRIHVIELRLPPLRERSGDIPLLAAHLLTRIAQQNGMTAPRLGVSALEVLARYPFPGNVRELENVLERALALAETDTLEARDLYLPARRPGGPAQGPRNLSVEGTSDPKGAPVAVSYSAGNPAGIHRMGDPAPQIDAATRGQSASLPVPPPPTASKPGDASTAGTATGDRDASLVEAIDAIQRQVILRTLEEARWNLIAAAKQLGMSPRSMRYRLVKLGIE